MDQCGWPLRICRQEWCIRWVNCNKNERREHIDAESFIGHSTYLIWGRAARWRLFVIIKSTSYCSAMLVVVKQSLTNQDVLKSWKYFYFEFLEHKLHVTKLSKLGFLTTTTEGVLLCLYMIICIAVQTIDVGCGTSGAVPPSSIKRA